MQRASSSFVYCSFAFFVHLPLIIYRELCHSSCLTSTQVQCNVSPSFWSRCSTLFFDYVIWTVTHFSINFCFFFSSELFQAFWITVKQGPYNAFLLFPSGHSTLLLPFKSLMTHSHCSVVWTVTFFITFCQMTLFLFILIVEQTHSSGVAATQGPGNNYLSFGSKKSIFKFSFGSLTIHSGYYVVGNTFSIVFDYFLCGNMPLF